MSAPAAPADGPARRPDPGRGARRSGLEDELRLSRAIATFEALVAERVPAAAGACRVDPARGRSRSTSRPTRRSSPRSSGCAAPSCWPPSRPRRAVSARASCGSTSAAGVPAYNPRHLPATSEAIARGRAPGAQPGPVGPRPSVPAAPRIAGSARSREARMAVRLQMKLGVVAEHDRLADSPDTLVVVEPSVGSVARSKGHLYLLVTSRISSRHGPRGDPAGRRDDPRRVLLRRVGRDPGLPREGDRARPTSGSPTRRDRLGLQGDRRQRPDRDRRRRRPRQRDVRRDGRAGRGLPDPPGAPLDPARPASRARPARPATSSRTSGAARSRSATRSSSSRRTSSPSSARTSSRTRC